MQGVGKACGWKHLRAPTFRSLFQDAVRPPPSWLPSGRPGWGRWRCRRSRRVRVRKWRKWGSPRRTGEEEREQSRRTRRAVPDRPENVYFLCHLQNFPISFPCVLFSLGGRGGRRRGSSSRAAGFRGCMDGCRPRMRNGEKRMYIAAACCPRAPLSSGCM